MSAEYAFTLLMHLQGHHEINIIPYQDLQSSASVIIFV